MSRIPLIGIVAMLVCGVATAQTVRSGPVELTKAEVEALRPAGGLSSVASTVDVNLVTNPGFESGALAPWTTDGWVVSTTNPNSGVYHAEALGNIFIRQDFAPVDVTTVSSVVISMLQPEVAISWICLFYEPSDQQCDLFFPQATWSQLDLVSLLRPAGNLTGIQVYGYSGGGGGPDVTYLDDVLIDSAIPVELQSLSTN
ncbi:MAG: hypothetical protein MUC56_09420 [Thermoanaerobaculales bacterium]|jgi:hypothetical protein|nr:hypothetical protein [Thermoanaerobaculales bacterium]